MYCPHCKHALTPAEVAAMMGARGGAAGKGSAERSKLNSNAAKARWKGHKKKSGNPPAGPA